MAHCCASGFSSTGGISWATHRAALLVPACVGVQTVVINPAFYLDTGYVGVTFVPVLAGTDWLVVDHPAEGMVTAGTGIFADFVDAGITFSTLVISGAS